MGQAKLRKTALVTVTYREIDRAYVNFIQFRRDNPGTQNFVSFVGASLMTWNRGDSKVLPRIARKIEMLNSPHWYALLKAYYYRRK